MLRSTTWDYFRFLETEPAARRFLSHQYALEGLDNPERLAFRQSTRFLYTLKQARSLYLQAAKSELLVQPLLLFYGCVHLLKALILTKTPDYPQSSRMMQHGVTTRKIKRSPYHLMQDEVRPQKEGLFSLLARLFIRFPLQDRYHVSQLFSFLPELVEEYALYGKQSIWCPVTCHDHLSYKVLSFPPANEGALGYSSQTFVDILNRTAPDGVTFVCFPTHEEGNVKRVMCMESTNPALTSHPLFVRLPSNRLFFWLHPSESVPLPRWASHYLLLYVLGMLCRYETEWWGELVFSNELDEIYLVERFLSVHLEWFPELIIHLFENKKASRPSSTDALHLAPSKLDTSECIRKDVDKSSTD